MEPGNQNFDAADRADLEADPAAFRMILDSAPSAILIVHQKGRILAANREAEALFGYGPEELEGRLVETLVPNRSRESHPQLRAKFHNEPTTRAMGHGRDLAAVRKDGSEFPVEVGLSVTPERPDLVSCVVTDLTERKQYEEERDHLLEDVETARARLSMLQHVTEAGLAPLPFEQLLAEMLKRALETVGGEAGSVLLFDEERTHLTGAATMGLDGYVAKDIRIPVGQGISGRVAATREAVVIEDIANDENHLVYGDPQDFRAVISCPLIVQGDVIGVITAISREPNHFSSSDMDLMRLIADRVALAADRAQAFERERSIAETLQRSLLPDKLPECAGLELAARYVAGTAGMKAGGDWYDVICLNDDRVIVVVGDVMGRGVRAAATMGHLRHATRIYLDVAESIVTVANQLHRMVLSLGEGQITTLLLAELNQSTGRLRWICAGHPPPLLRSPDGSVTLLDGEPDPPLGSSAEVSFSPREAQLHPGSTLMIYTDGLIERRSQDLDVGLDRLLQAASGAPGDATQFCDRVLQVLTSDEPVKDDIAIVTVRRDPLSVEPLAVQLPRTSEAGRSVRERLRIWLRDAGATDDETDELVAAAGEAVAAATRENPEKEELVLVSAAKYGDRVQVNVSDGVSHEPPSGTDRGRGLVLMEGLVDELVINKADEANELRLSRELRLSSRRRHEDDGG